MPRDPNVLYREYSDWPVWVWVLIVVAIGAAVLAIRTDPGSPPALLPFVASAPVLYWLFFGRLRIDLTRDALHLQFGRVPLIRKVVPLSRIRASEVVTYRPMVEFGGWGVRWRPGRTAWTTRGNQAVRLTLDDGKLLYVGSPNPHRLRQRIVAVAGREAGP